MSETNAQSQLSANETKVMREAYLRSKDELSEVKSFFLATREKLEASKKQVAAWKDECRFIILKGHDKRRQV